MARPNYGAAKRTKELKKKAKREAKLARRHARRADQGQPESAADAPPRSLHPPREPDRARTDLPPRVTLRLTRPRDSAT